MPKKSQHSAAEATWERKNQCERGDKKCYFCHKAGYIAKNCFKKKDSKKCNYCKKNVREIADC